MSLQTLLFSFPLGSPPGRRVSCHRASSTSPNLRHWPSAQGPGVKTSSEDLPNTLEAAAEPQLPVGAPCFNPWSQFSPFCLRPRTQILVIALCSYICLYCLQPRHRPCSLAMPHTVLPSFMHTCYTPAQLQRGPGCNRLPLGPGKPSFHSSF
jgi:hypothetical protein